MKTNWIKLTAKEIKSLGEKPSALSSCEVIRLKPKTTPDIPASKPVVDHPANGEDAPDKRVIGKRDKVKAKNKSNLAIIHGGNGQLRGGGIASPNDVAYTERLVSRKRSKRKRARRKGTRDYLPYCEGEYYPKVKTEREFYFACEIQPFASRDKFRLDVTDQIPLPLEQGKVKYRAIFLRWCKARDISDKFTISFRKEGNTVYMIAQGGELGAHPSAYGKRGY